MGETANMIISRSRISEIVVWVIVVAILAAGAQSEEIRTAEDAARSADGQGKEFISSLVEIKDSPDECYDTLKRRLLEGHFDDVKAGLDLRDDQGRRIFEDYRFARLRALCARAIFRRYSYRIATSGRANEKQGARLRKLAKETTAAYEEAFRLAPSDFERACIYARWHEIHTYRHFEADSLLLRSGSPLEYQDKPVDEALSSQVMRLRSAAARILGSAAPYDKPMGADAKTAFLNVLIDEYRKLGRIGVPEEVFREVLNDLPVFLQRGLSPRVLFEPEVKRIMIRYHLWYALTGPRPDRIDNEFLDQQLQTVDRYIREGFTDKLSTEDTDVASAIFLECSGLVRSNCFLPRLKETLWPFEWSEPRYKGQENMEDRILKEIDETVTRLVKNQDRWVSRSRTFSENQKLIREWTDIALRSMSSSLMLQLTINQRLGHLRQPPSAILGGGSGGGVSGFWVYQTHRYNPVQPYPWKKSITALDSRTASTRQIAHRVLEAIVGGDKATLGTLVSESRDFSRRDVHTLADVLKEEVYAAAPEQMLKIEHILIEKASSWSVVRMMPPTEEASKALVMVFQSKQGGYWLTWAGLVERPEKESLSDMLTRLKPDLELPPAPEPVEIAKPVDIAFIDDISKIESLESIKAGHSWRVQLALAEGNTSAPWKLLYCRAEWTDQDHPARPVPFGRYIGRHLGPVVWTMSKEGFRETGPDLNSRPAPPISIEGNGAVYAATLPLGGFEQAYLQVYSAFDGRELARQRITEDKSSAWPWGRFMEHRKNETFGVSADFVAACPGMPAFKPMPTKATGQSDHSINLSVKDGFFSLKTDKRIIPTRGSRLLARWWLNGRPVSPQTAEEFVVTGSSHTEGLASLLRLPAKLPIKVLKARPGNKVGLQVMLSPDRIESSEFNTESSQCIASLDIDGSPAVPILSNRLDFKVNAAIIAQRSSKPVTAASLKKFTDAICEGNKRTVRRMVSECPQLARALDASGRSALEVTCRERPRARYLGPMKIGGDMDVKHWKERAEIAGILIDYGADVNAKTRARPTLLHTVVDPIFSYRTDDVPPVELVRTLLDRGTNIELSGHKGTVLLEAVGNLRSERSKMMAPVIEVLLEYGADVLAVCEPWHREPVYELVDELTKQGHKNLADIIRKRGAIRRKALGLAVRAGVEEFLARVRNADEQALLSLEKELPWTRNIRILSVGRNLQKEYGSDLKAVGSIAALLLKGDWAEVTLPTGHRGDKAYMRIVLMRYPGGAYHVVEAGWTDGRDLGGRIRNASMHYDDLMNAIYSAFGWMHKCKVSGGRKTGYPRHFSSVSICSEQDRLIVRGRNVPSWIHFRAEITPNLVWNWDDTWSLNLASNMTFERDERKMVMADGSLTVQNKDKIVVFTKSGGQVRMEAGGKEMLGPEFVLDLKTLEVEP